MAFTREKGPHQEATILDRIPTSTFEKALIRYIESLPEKSNTRKMFVSSLETTSTNAVTEDSIAAIIEDVQKKASQRITVRAFNRLVKPVVDVLKEYYGIIDTICQANQMPGSVIWGSLKIIIDCASRFDQLFETIKTQLQEVRKHLDVITWFSDLYKDDNMQELLCQSYITVLRFWARVRKECDRNTLSSFLRATGPFNTKKMDAIVLDLKKDADNIEELGNIIEKGRAGRERYLNTIERIKAETERRAAAKHREQQQEDRKVDQFLTIRKWLGTESSIQGLEQKADIYRKQYREDHLPETSKWIFCTPEFQEWYTHKPHRPIIWLSGDPGAGKSMICSRVINELQVRKPEAAVATHFYRFDQPVSLHDVYRTIASQILDKLWTVKQEIPPMVYELVRTSNNSGDNILKLIWIMASSQALEDVYILLDGIDEEIPERRWDMAACALRDLMKLTSADTSKKIHLWISSQAHHIVEESLKDQPRIHITDQNDDDLELFFDTSLPHLQHMDLPAEDKKRLVEKLKDRANGNFLWARCMIEDLKDGLESAAGLKEVLESGLPWDINKYFQRQFSSIGDRHRDLASKIFSIVCFARRRVSLAEIHDAITMMRSSSTRDENHKPFPGLVQKLLPPLIILESGQTDQQRYCRLYHSTVKAFVRKNPFVLANDAQEKEALAIEPSGLANLCLQYLSQDRYRLPLILKDGEWKDSQGRQIDNDELLQYAAKYWDKHLEDVRPVPPDLLHKTCEFVLSSNFQTLLQIQNLYVAGQFVVFTRSKVPKRWKFLRRVFPEWFVREKSRVDGPRMWYDYRSFIHEWSYFLGCGFCENPICLKKRFAGEIDRCMFGALGDDNFMSGFQSRYLSFKLSTNENVCIKNTRQCYDGYSECGRQVYLVQFFSRTAFHLEFLCETWSLAHGAKPTCIRRQTIEASKEESHWPLYFRCDDQNVTVRTGRAKPVAFDRCARCLRIGSQIFRRDTNGIFKPISPQLQAAAKLPTYFEEFVSTSGLVILASRRSERSCIEPKVEEDIMDQNVQDITNLFEDGWSQDDDTDGILSVGGSDSSESPFADDSTTDPGEDWTSGAETWSEASTEPDDMVQDDNALAVFKGYVDSSPNSSSESQETDDDTDDTDSENDSDELGAAPFSRFLRGFLDDDSDADDVYVDISESGDESGAVAAHFRKKYRYRKEKTDVSLKASLSVLYINQEGLRCSFRLSRALHQMLYDSPPVVHPSKPLLVWPISPGNILFADFEQKMWFTRKLRPTTSYTRQVFIKCHFSPCGQYLHIAALEGRRKLQPQNSRTRRAIKSSKSSDKMVDTKEHPLHLSLFVSTYRLSTRKTTRAPPTQIYRTKLALGTTSFLPVDHLPFTVTWTPSHLYLTRSSVVLDVHKIALFRGPEDAAALVPRDTVFLPYTAHHREIRYFPVETATDGGSRGIGATVLIGPEAKNTSATPLGKKFEAETCEHVREGVFWVPKYEGVQGLEGRAALPVGFYLKDESEFGGWVRSEHVVRVPEDKGVGRLDGKVERFDVEEDCDLEPYIL